jgi:hypothetical protein
MPKLTTIPERDADARAHEDMMQKDKAHRVKIPHPYSLDCR